MLQVRRHVDPRPGLSLLNIITESHSGLTLREVEHSWLRRRVFREFLPLTEAEDHGFHAIILEDRAAQDAIRRRLCLFGKIEDVGVRGGHGRRFSHRRGQTC